MDNVSMTEEQVERRRETARADRKRRLREDAKVRRQTCPRCKAAVAEDCHSEPGWHQTDFHADRKSLAGVKW